MTVTATPRRKAIDRARAKYETDPKGPFTYPALPQAADPAYNYWCVYLAYPDGTVLQGPHPAFPIENVLEAIVKDDRHPFKDPGFIKALTEQQQYLLEHLQPDVVTDKNGRPVTQPTRWWQLVENANQRYTEDPRVAVRSASPFVRKITLYCPLTESGPSGAKEDHGAYDGVGATVDEDFDGELGACPKCAKHPERQIRALTKIFEQYQSAAAKKVPMNPALQQRILLNGPTGKRLLVEGTSA